MSQRMPWKDAAKALNLPENAMYQAIRQGILPAWRIGTPGKRGRLIVDVDLCEQAIKNKMMENMHPREEEQIYAPIHKRK